MCCICVMFLLSAHCCIPLISSNLPHFFRGYIISFLLINIYIHLQGVNFFVGLLFLRLLEQLGPKLLYTFFATCCLIGFAFVKKNVLETKGKSLQEIELALLPAWWRCGCWDVFILFITIAILIWAQAVTKMHCIKQIYFCIYLG